MSAYEKPSLKEVAEQKHQKSKTSPGYQELQRLRDKLKAENKRGFTKIRS